MQRKNLEIMAVAAVAIAVCALASFVMFSGDDHVPTVTDPDYLPNPITDDLRDYPDAESCPKMLTQTRSWSVPSP